MPAPVDIARQQLGVREPSAYSLYTGGRVESWCAHFASWVFREAGVPLAGYIIPTPSTANPTASVDFIAKQMRMLGRLLPATATPQANDLVFYKKTVDGRFVSPGPYDLAFDLGHVGIVEGVDKDKLVTIEGNVSDTVARVRTPLNNPSIAYYGRPLTAAQLAAAGGIGLGAVAVIGIGVYLLMRSRK